MNLSIPVTVKFRMFPSLEQAAEYVKMLESVGAQILSNFLHAMAGLVASEVSNSP